jgi:predicted nucleic acid-binding protein
VKPVIVDTGPLVAFLNRRDRFHSWARETLGTIEAPLITCEAVVSEACFLLRSAKGGPDAILELLARGIVQVRFRLDAELGSVRKLMTRYASVPMSLADACLVRMTELDAAARVLTLDADFGIYRRHRRNVVPTIMPPPERR